MIEVEKTAALPCASPDGLVACATMEVHCLLCAPPSVGMPCQPTALFVAGAATPSHTHIWCHHFGCTPSRALRRHSSR